RDPPEAAPAPDWRRCGDPLFLGTILSLARRLCRADAYAIWQRDPGSGEWRAIADAGLSAAYCRRMVGQPAPISGEVVHLQDVTHAELPEERKAAFEAEGIRALLSAPLAIRGEHTATLTCCYRQAHPLDQAEADSAVDLADLASRAITAAQLHQE